MPRSWIHAEAKVRGVVRRWGWSAAYCGTILCICLAFAVVIWAVMAHLRADAQARAAFSRSHEISINVTRLLGTLLGLEVEAHGYLLSGEPAYLDPYARHLAQARGEIGRLAADAGDPSQGADLRETAALAAAWLDALEQAVEAGRERQRQDPNALPAEAVNRAGIDAIQRAADRILARTVTGWQAREDVEDLRASWTLGLVLGVLGTVTLALLVVIHLYRRFVTRTVRHEADARAMAAILGDTLASIGQGVGMFDAERRLLIANSRFGRMLDLPPALAVAGTPLGTIAAHVDGLVDRHRDDILALLERIRISGKSEELVLRSGRRLDISPNISSTADRLVLTLSDVTQQRWNERRVEETASRLGALMTAAIDGIVTINESGEIESFSPAAESIFGWRAEEVLGRNVRVLMPEPFASLHDSYLRRYEATGQAKVMGTVREVEALRKDGSRVPIDIAVNSVQLDSRRLYMAIVRDVSDRRRMERVKSEFVSTVSHELRTPLTAIAGSLSLIAGRSAGEVPVKVQRLIEIAHKNCERLVRLINDILDVEKLGSGRSEFSFRPMSIRSLVEQSVEANRGYAARFDVRLELAGDAADTIVFGDSDRLHQVLTNLISNAVKYSPPGEAVTIDIEQQTERVLLSVTDRGPGIPEMFRDRIFEQFSQIDGSDARERGGTGLGLHIARSIVLRHSGRIGFDSVSEPGGGRPTGTNFWVELPRWRGTVDLPTQVARPATPGDNGPILIIEDEPDVAHILRGVLELEGFVTEVATSAAAALVRCRAIPFALILVDLVLPDSDGLTLIRTLRAEETTRGTPIIVVSARAEDGRRLVTPEPLHVMDWLAKPFDPGRLLRAVRNATTPLGQGRPLLLHIEDDADLVTIVRQAAGDSCDILVAGTLAEARRMLAERSFNLVILDLSLPDGNGLELLPIPTPAGSRPPPVIVFSADEPTRDVALLVQAELTKSRASIERLMETVTGLVYGDSTTTPTRDEVKA